MPDTVASLCWYPATRPAWERLWQGVRARLGWGPEALSWPEEAGAHWRDPGLVLSMTCAMPMRLGLARQAVVVGSPVWDLPGLPPGHYASHIVMRADDPRDPATAAAAGIAANAPDSQSGRGVLDAAGLEGPIAYTGSHAAAMLAVAAGRAHLAAIDVVTWRMAPHSALAIRATTPPTPATPFITARPEWRAPVRTALTAAIAAMPPADRAATRLIGVTDLAPAAYAAA
ncbi:PhnD/SsuA/transferrin family substrate-binding protein [Jannaschia ovalis]|uniref:PhnD/SsuA/transferrin family substrate-binding protein n=1 Tax=Jannaschia ovalis TaxID=3038773 RepID=A0ABY8LEJ1_9RHOB|nr:PhnD/SsuA/transferrin family substrate-binding protein [Jannaschia sp. GRR-S6-38]WGH79736.1 PhnD/SsuA/transferrin family substrate-binding protein [Jannaschia sp. GRR-S6-38]